MNAPVRIENRAQLIYLLTEAAELEHGISCCYLFTAFSMKRDVKEGITQAQLGKVRRWRGTILQIAIQEMVHMSLACNLLTAVGGAPHVRRPNLPASPRAYPPSFTLQLLPFTLETVKAFVFVERPESQEPQDTSPGLQTQPPGKFSDIFSSERQYETVGHLYRGIEDGFRYLTQKFGEEGLFIGPPHAQIADAYFSLPGLIPVTNLESAIAAIEGIVEQGEGAREDNRDSHYGRFVTIQEEYEELLKEDPDFVPGRPVAPNPYSMFPNDLVDLDAVSQIEDPLAVDVCNLFDGCYEILIQMLGRLLMHSGETEEQLTLLADITVGMMMDIISPLGEALTTLPMGESHPGLAAGPSFRFSRDANNLPHQEAAWSLMAERFKELSAYSGLMEGPEEVVTVLRKVRGCLSQYARQMDQV